MTKSFFWCGQSVFELVDPAVACGKPKCFASFRKYMRKVRRPRGIMYAICVTVAPEKLSLLYGRTTTESRTLVNEALHAAYPGCTITRNDELV